MRKRLIITLSCLLIALSGAAILPPATADAAPRCAAVHVLFARGTAETAPPLGITGIAFENSLRNAIRGKSVRVEAVNYRASASFSNRIAFASTFVHGVSAAQKRIKQIAAACPQTKIVVGGYSQGAALAAFTVADNVTLPPAYQRYRAYVPKPLPAALAARVKAVILFGPPSDRFLRDAGAPVMRVGQAYRGKTLRLCAAGDNICNGARLSGPNAIHLSYPVNGMTTRAANYVARRV